MTRQFSDYKVMRAGSARGAVRARRAQGGREGGGLRARDVPEVQGAARSRAAVRRARALLPRPERQARRLRHQGEALRELQAAQDRDRVRAPLRARGGLPAEEAGVRGRPPGRAARRGRPRAVARVPGRVRHQAGVPGVLHLERVDGDLGGRLRLSGRRRRALERQRPQAARRPGALLGLRDVGVPALPQPDARPRRDPGDRGVAREAPHRRPHRSGDPRRHPRALPRLLALRLQPGARARELHAVGPARDRAAGPVDGARQGRQPAADGDAAACSRASTATSRWTTTACARSSSTTRRRPTPTCTCARSCAGPTAAGRRRTGTAGRRSSSAATSRARTSAR